MKKQSTLKRALALGMSATMVGATLAGCGGSASSTAATSTETASSAATEAEATTDSDKPFAGTTLTWYTGAGVLRGNACPRHQLFDEFFTVGARQLVRTLGHDKLRGKVGAHAGGVDHAAARRHDLIKGIVDIHRAQRIAAQNLFSIAHVGAKACNMQNRFYLAAFGGVFGQRKTAFTVRNIAAERLDLAARRAQVSDRFVCLPAGDGH